jgi:hypothetical protein
MPQSATHYLLFLLGQERFRINEKSDGTLPGAENRLFIPGFALSFGCFKSALCVVLLLLSPCAEKAASPGLHDFHSESSSLGRTGDIQKQKLIYSKDRALKLMHAPIQ